MTRAEFNRAVLIAQSKADLSQVSDDHLHGCGLPGFEPVQTTLAAVAKFLRWQCQYIFGNGWDEQEMNNCWRIARSKFNIVGDGSDDSASLPGRLIAQALGILEVEQ